MTRLKSNLPAVQKRYQAAAKRGLTDAIMIAHGDVMREVPVDTGLLRASIAWAVDGRRQHHATATNQDGTVLTSNYTAEAPNGSARLGTNVEYAVAVHEGVEQKSVRVRSHEVGAHTRKISTAFGRPIAPQDVAVQPHTRKAHVREQEARSGFKFLEGPMRQRQDVYRRVIADALREGMK